MKIQIEFNSQRISEYRLIGYENRLLNEEDFANDTVDAGEIGAGHRVTALYEINLAGSKSQRLPTRRYTDNMEPKSQPGQELSNELAHLRIRFKLPHGSKSQIIESPIMDNDIKTAGNDSFSFAAAVAAFGQKLRGGEYLESFSYDDIAQLARRSRGDDPHGYRSEFMQLVSLVDTLDRATNFTQHVDREADRN